MSFEVRNALIEDLLKKLGRSLKAEMPLGFGFTLMIFDYGKTDGSAMFYISSADRQDMIKAMREFIQRYEAN